MPFSSTEAAHEYYLTHRAWMRKQQKQRRDRLKAAGLCPSCGFRKKPGDNHTLCDYCRLRWVVNRDERRATDSARHYNRITD